MTKKEKLIKHKKQKKEVKSKDVVKAKGVEDFKASGSHTPYSF